MRAADTREPTWWAEAVGRAASREMELELKWSRWGGGEAADGKAEGKAVES